MPIYIYDSPSSTSQNIACQMQFIANSAGSIKLVLVLINSEVVIVNCFKSKVKITEI